MAKSIINEWIDFFSDGSEANQSLYINCSKQNSIGEVGNAYLYECVFVFISSPGNGAAIRFVTESSSSKLLVEYCIFNTCNSTYNGGAIFFKQGQCVLSHNCGVRCNARENGGYGQLSAATVSPGNDNKNYVIDCSIILTLSRKSVERTLYHNNGNILFIGVNISHNTVRRHSGFSVYNISTCSISFCSFSHNKAIGSNSYSCIHFITGLSYQMTNTNIIENTQESSSKGIIYTWNSAQLTMNHCSIYGNCQLYSGRVFYADTKTSITCIDCSMSEDQISTGGSVTIYVTSEPFINSYEFLELDECHAGIDRYNCCLYTKT